MAKPSPANLRAFVRRQTRLVPVADLPDLRLHLADDVTKLWHLAGRELGDDDPGLPYWGFAWPGGLAIARYLRDNPAEVAGARVLDIAAGSGLCGIVAMRLGAASVLAIDVDPMAEATVALNARANGVRIGFRRRDLLDESPPACDVILAGDVCYQETMSTRMLAWLRFAASDGTRVLIGDPGRAYLPTDLERLAAYRVLTSREIERSELTDVTVYTIPSTG